MRETKNNIVAAIKGLGYSTRQVSVSRRGNTSSAYRVEVRDPKVNIEAVENAVTCFEKIDRCEASGEILGGGNTFIFVSASKEVLGAWAAENLPVVVKAAMQTERGTNRGVQINENYSLYEVGTNQYQLYYTKPASCVGGRIGYERMTAEQVAIQMHLNNQKVAVNA